MPCGDGGDVGGLGGGDSGDYVGSVRPRAQAEVRIGGGGPPAKTPCAAEGALCVGESYCTRARARVCGALLDSFNLPRFGGAFFCSELLLSRVTDELARASIVGQ